MVNLKNSRMIALVGVLLVLCGLFLPWITWERSPYVPAGFTIGLNTVDGWILLVFTLIAGYFSFEEPGGLNSMFVIIFGSFIFFGASLDIGNPQGFVPSGLNLPSILVHTAIGLYAEQVGGFLVLLYGIFTITRFPIHSNKKFLSHFIGK